MSNTLAARLRRARALSGLSARELSKVAGLSASYVSLVEAERSKLGAETASKLARALGVTMEWLIDGTGEEPDAIVVTDLRAT